MGSFGVVEFEHRVVRAFEQERERWILVKGV